ncbi:ABC transporter permease [Labrys wisconsinensis]|uniref:Microcin C transport system permease protein n=1 Tax=Labrys wisconsinensis TaxID=425677 RepID=A0ABU0J7I7_9HYPH|nr:ABC transporter permease [Labrys wisconsinensis]MDQ0470232.1 microcin C transport system permease protein [Labrys wisconsinensis]
MDAPNPAARRRWVLSPLNRRRWRNFKASRRGYVSLWVFGILFVLSLFAEFIANDKPFLVQYDGHTYVPVFSAYPETTFGGDFETEADYRDPYLTKLIQDKGGFMLWPPIRYSYDTINKNAPKPFPSPPTWTLSDADCKEAAARVGGTGCRDLEWNWLGTDANGRDLIARVIYGFRLSVVFGLILTVLSSIIGVAAGAVQGYFGGWTDLIFQRAIEIWTSIPTLYLLIILAAVLAPSFWLLLGILLLFSWTTLVGVVRAEFLRARNFEYVRAARALGLSNFAIIRKHLLPNATVATLTMMPFVLNAGISTLTSLDYLGFGLPPGSPSLGELMRQAADNAQQAPWIGITGFFVIAGMMALMIFIGEAVRDALDPRKTFA